MLMKTVSHIISSLFRIPILSISILLLFSCCNNNDDIIWDMCPVDITIKIKDANGNNLLSPSVPGNIRGKKIVAEYQGQEYELNWDEPYPSRYYRPFFYGLTLGRGYTQTQNDSYLDDNKSYLFFGEFDGVGDQDISISLYIEGYPDPWNISVTHRVKWKRNTPHVTNTATFNGKNISYGTITIVL